MNSTQNGYQPGSRKGKIKSSSGAPKHQPAYWAMANYISKTRQQLWSWDFLFLFFCNTIPGLLHRRRKTPAQDGQRTLVSARRKAAPVSAGMVSKDSSDFLQSLESWNIDPNPWKH